MRIVSLLGDGGIPAARLAGLGDLDRVVVRPAPWALRIIWGGRAAAMTIMHRVYVDPRLLSDSAERLTPLLLHELVHVRQWRDAGPVRFLFRYVTDYLGARLRGRPHHAAYRGIRYEVEARRIAGL